MNKKAYIFIYISIIVPIFALLFITSFFTVNYFRNQQPASIDELADKEKIEKYEYILNNLNEIALNTVFSGAADTEKKENARQFTAFSLFYKEKFYIITAGHSIDFEGVKYEKFRVKPNNKDIWFYPELIYYKNDLDNNNDFAIFRYNYIYTGLYPSEDNLIPEFVVGNTARRSSNILKIYEKGLYYFYGESGSPVLNGNCRVVGVLIKNTGEYTDIKKILDAIDGLK